MGKSTDASAEKRAELTQTISAACAAMGNPIDEGCAAGLIDHLATITAPQYSTVVRLVTMDLGGRDGGSSVKPGNILLDMRRLITAVASGVLTVVGVAEVPWTAVFGALVLWDTLYAGARIELSEREAAVLWTLWLLRDGAYTAPQAGLLEAVNVERERYGRSRLTQQEFDDALRKLERISSIEQSSNDPSRWWLREWVRITYE